MPYDPTLTRFSSRAVHPPDPNHVKYWADLATERERQLTKARANQTTGLTNGKAANWATGSRV